MKIKGKKVLIFAITMITFFTVISNFSLVLATQQNSSPTTILAAKKGKKTKTPVSTSNPIDNPDGYKPGEIDKTDIEPITNKGAIILNTLTTIGVVVSVIVLVILGIKYMIGSVQEKAEYKKTMLPYLIGVFMLAGITGVLGILAGIVGDLSSTM